MNASICNRRDLHSTSGWSLKIIYLYTRKTLCVAGQYIRWTIRCAEAQCSLHSGSHTSAIFLVVSSVYVLSHFLEKWHWTNHFCLSIACLRCWVLGIIIETLLLNKTLEFELHQLYFKRAKFGCEFENRALHYWSSSEPKTRRIHVSNKVELVGTLWRHLKTYCVRWISMSNIYFDVTRTTCLRSDVENLVDIEDSCGRQGAAMLSFRLKLDFARRRKYLEIFLWKLSGRSNWYRQLSSEHASWLSRTLELGNTGDEFHYWMPCSTCTSHSSSQSRSSSPLQPRSGALWRQSAVGYSYE